MWIGLAPGGSEIDDHPCLCFQATFLNWASVEKVRDFLDLLGSCRLEGQQEDMEKELKGHSPP